jgi:beta-glucosidase/6-phospho-beta-glucosidase/beta-galactosidase
MTNLRIGPGAEDFLWASGIEDTFVPQTRPGHRALDEYELMGHYRHWREDLALARELGMKAIRWGVPWYRVEPRPGDFDWRWTDEVLPYIVDELGITPIVDLMHYGCPFWLRREFVNPGYPEAVARYAEAFAARYAHLLQWYTPLNEPIVNALMCGLRGQWPPYLRGDRGYVRVMVQLAKGIVRTVKAIQAVDPDAIMVHVEATGLSRAARTDLHTLAADEQRRNFLCFDLITGRVTPEHSLFAWLVRSGATPDDLAALAATPVTLDVVGLNFYPQWSTQQLYVDAKGRLAYRTAEHEGSGFGQLIHDFYRRYRAPVMITETSAVGDDVLRLRWLDASLAAVRHLRGRGVPIIGYTWFPMFTMIDWRYRLGTADVEEYRIELGLYKLSGAILGSRWEATPLVEQMRAAIADPKTAVGTLSYAAPLTRLAALIAGRRDAYESNFDPEATGMHKREKTLEDGRRFVFYAFDEAAGATAGDARDRADEGDRDV